MPVADIKKIDLGLRIPDDVAKKIEDAVKKLADATFKTRELATNDLLTYREKAVPACGWRPRRPTPRSGAGRGDLGQAEGGAACRPL